jgi:hypothetical protein
LFGSPSDRDPGVFKRVTSGFVTNYRRFAATTFLIGQDGKLDALPPLEPSVALLSGLGDSAQMCNNHGTLAGTHRMMKIAATLLSACLTIAGCASAPSTTGTTVRAIPPKNHESAITNYFDATAKGIDPNRELVIGTPQRGACPMGGIGGGYVGWVVPVEYKTRSKDSSVVTVTSYYFWFSDEVIRGITRRMEVCP